MMALDPWIAASLKNVLGKIAALATDKAVQLIELTAKHKAINHAAQRLQDIGNVKTLWQIDKEVSISDFFVPPGVSYLDKEFSVKSFADLPNVRCLVIEGILGQGKSILLRQLALSSLRENYIPIFISAHTLTAAKSVRQKICEYFSDLAKREISLQECEKLLDTQFFILFIDGFDEVDPSLEPTLIEEVRSICRRHDDALRIVVTSRPDNAIQKCAEFRVLRIRDLDTDKRNQIIQRLCDESDSKELIRSLNNASSESAKGLLMTPLMVTILVIVYRAERRVPETFAEFFENLFSILLIRHDGTKPGFSRNRKTKLANGDFRRLFEAFCFISRKEQLPTAMSPSQVENAVERAAKAIGITVASDAYVQDVKRVTCLLIEESMKLFFVHKAIQHFFSAQFIKSCPEENVKAFYSDLANTEKWVEWAPELAFLRRIDAYNFYNSFYFKGLSKQRYFDPEHLISDAEVEQILELIQIDANSHQIEIKVTPPNSPSMAERDFLVEFALRQLLTELVKYAESDETNIDLPFGSEAFVRERSALQKRAIVEALRQFKIRIEEARKIGHTLRQKSALLLSH